jgi:hypothetical protein
MSQANKDVLQAVLVHAKEVEAVLSKPVPPNAPVQPAHVTAAMLARFAHTSQQLVAILLDHETRLEKAGF